MRDGQKTLDAGARKGRKVARHCVLSGIGGLGGSKSRLAKARVQSQMRDEKVHAIAARSTCSSEKCQN